MARGAAEVKIIRVTPTISTSAYSTGFQVGTLQTLSQAAPDAMYGAILHSISIIDGSKQDAAFDIILFDGSPTITSGDRAAANITLANAKNKIAGIIQVTTYSDLSGISIGFANGLSAVLAPQANVDLYALPVIRGSATYATTSSLQFIYSFIQDRRD